MAEISMLNRKVLVDSDDLLPPDGYDYVVPVVFAANDNYAPYAGVAIESIIENIHSHHYYRIYILHTGLSGWNILKLESLKKDNISISCLNVYDLIHSKGIKLFKNGHLTEECFYRILIPEIFSFYTHVIYLDCDIIVNTDIADIISEDMGNSLIGAVRNIVGPVSGKHFTENLHLDITKYVNSGVLVINISQWIKENKIDQCIQIIANTPPEYLRNSDQEVINIVCKDRIYFLNESWNFLWHMIYGPPDYVEICKPTVEKVQNKYYILHFASPIKPWSSPELPLSHYFWKYARKTIFYEEIIRNNCKEGDDIQNKIVDIQNQQLRVNQELFSIRNSRSYRIGRAITWIPRKIRSILTLLLKS